MTRITTAAPTVRDAGTRKKREEAKSGPAIGDRIEARRVLRLAFRLSPALEFPTSVEWTP
jgi:hypothetical protein